MPRKGRAPKQTEFRYDAVDNRTAQLDANEHQTLWEYDAMDRMTDHFRFRIADCGLAEAPVHTDHPAQEVRWEPWRAVKSFGATKSEIRNPKSAMLEWEWTFDSLNRMTGRAEPPIGISDPNYGQLVTLWYYDPNGNLTRLVGPDGGLTDYDYDERNRMTTVIRKDTENDPNPRITTYDYYENNLLKLKTLPNGCEAYQEYDELDRLTLLVNRKSDQTVISSFAIEYRDDDNKSTITREDGTVIE